LSACNLTTDKVTRKEHVEAVLYDAKTTQFNEDKCHVIDHGVWTVSSNDKTMAVCRVDEQWLVCHAKKGGAETCEAVQKSYYDAVKVGDKWKP